MDAGLGDVSRESKLVIGLVSGSEFINHTYIVLLPPILGLLAADFRVSLALLGVALGARGAATAAFQLPFGYVSDHYDRTIGLGLSLGLGSLGALLTAVAPDFRSLLAAQVLIGVGIAGHHPSHFPLLSEAVAESYRARVFSVRGFAGAIGFGVPPLVFTAVLALPGTSWRHGVGLLGLLGLAYGLVAVVLIRRYVSEAVRVPDPADRAEPAFGTSITEKVRAELRSLAASPPVLALGALTFVTAVVTNGFRTFIVVHLTDGYGLPLATANLTLTAVFVVGAVVMLAGGYLADAIPSGTVLLSVYAVVAVLTAVIASLAIPALLAMLVAIVIGGVRSGAAPARNKLVDRFAPGGAIGQSFAVMTIGMMLGGTVAPPVFGYLIEAAGLRVAFLAMAAVMAVGVAFAAVIVARYDDRFSFSRPFALLED